MILAGGCPCRRPRKIAFATADGLFNFKVMPYGLCYSEATFQRLIELILAGLHWFTCLLYVDDIFCFSKTVRQQIDRLDEILTRIRDAGLKLSPGKCKFLCWGTMCPNRVSRQTLRRFAPLGNGPNPRTCMN